MGQRRSIAGSRMLITGASQGIGRALAIEAAGLDYQVNLVAAIGLRQVFTADPNNVLLELNFFGD